MANIDISRQCAAYPSLVNAQKFSMAQSSGGLIHIISGGSGGALTFTVWYGEFLQANSTLTKSDNTALTMTVSDGRSYALPDELFAARLVSISNASSNIVFSITLKT